MSRWTLCPPRGASRPASLGPVTRRVHVAVLSLFTHPRRLLSPSYTLYSRVLLVADRVQFVADRVLFLADRVQCVADRVQFVADRALFVADRVVFVADRVLFVADRVFTCVPLDRTPLTCTVRILHREVTYSALPLWFTCTINPQPKVFEVKFSLREIRRIFSVKLLNFKFLKTP